MTVRAKQTYIALVKSRVVTNPTASPRVKRVSGFAPGTKKRWTSLKFTIKHGRFTGKPVSMPTLFPVALAILPLCENCCIIIALTWIMLSSKNKKHLRGSTSGHNTPFVHHTDHSATGLGQHNNLGVYCGPHPLYFL